MGSMTKRILFALFGAVAFSLTIASLIGAVFGTIVLLVWLGVPVDIAAFAPATIVMLYLVKQHNMTIPELAQLIADELVAQGNEIDNLGDNESVVLLGKSPCINLVQLAERIIADRGGRHDAGRS